MHRDSVTLYAEFPAERCPGCTLQYPAIPSGKLDNIACLANKQLRRNAGLSQLACSLIEARYDLDYSDRDPTTGTVEIILASVDIMPPGGIDQIVEYESSKFGTGNGYVFGIKLEEPLPASA